MTRSLSALLATKATCRNDVGSLVRIPLLCFTVKLWYATCMNTFFPAHAFPGYNVTPLLTQKLDSLMAELTMPT